MGGVFWRLATPHQDSLAPVGPLRRDSTTVFVPFSADFYNLMLAQRSCNAPLVGSDAIEESRERR